MQRADNVNGSGRCLWCEQSLSPGNTICPTCGATVPRAEPVDAPDARIEEPERRQDPGIAGLSEEALPPVVAVPDVADHLVQTGIVLTITGAIGGVLGLLIASPIAARVLSSLLGMAELEAFGFARLGILVGVLFGVLVGAAYMAVARQ